MTSVIKPPSGGNTSIVKQEQAPDFGDGQRRVRDTDLGEWLGFKQPRIIRQLIKRTFAESELPHSRCTVHRQSTGHGASRTYEVREYWLTEQEAIFLIARSRTKVAPDALRRTLANLTAPKPDAAMKLATLEQRFGELTALVTSLVTALRPALPPEVEARRAKWREEKKRQRERKALAREKAVEVPWWRRLEKAPAGQPPKLPPRPPVVAPAPAEEPRKVRILDRGLSCWGATFCGVLHHSTAEAIACNNRYFQQTGRWRDIGEAMLLSDHPFPIIDGTTVDRVSEAVRAEAIQGRLPVPPRPLAN